MLNRLLWISIFVRRLIVGAIVAFAIGALVVLAIGLIALVAPWNGWFVFEIGPFAVFEHYEDESGFGVFTRDLPPVFGHAGRPGVRDPLGSSSRLETVT